MQNMRLGQGIFHKGRPVDETGIIPYYQLMTENALLRDAKDTLSYIDGLKQEIAALLYSKTHLMYSGIHVPEADFTHAIQCINEAIDDLFYLQSREARDMLGI